MNTILTILILLLVLGSIFLYLKKQNKFEVSAELKTEVTDHPLQTSGEIPNWLSGTLVRNGPVTVTINGKSNTHWFDGLAMLHAFSFQDGKVYYTNKFLRSDAYHSVFSEGSLNYGGFAVDPCRSIFKRFLTFFIPKIHNANVNVTKIADQYVALTETPLPVRFDIETLATLGVLNYQDQLPKDKCWESVHMHYDAEKNEKLNYLVKFGRTSYYTLYSIQDGSAERKIIAEIPVSNPAYMHSFALTENYVILTEFPLVVNPIDLITKHQPFIKNYTWQPQRGTQFIVIDRKNGNVVGKYKTKPFFAFHHANAFEENGKIHIDIVTYNDADIIIGERFYLASDKPITKNYPAQLERFSVSLTSGEITSTVLLAKLIEFPRIYEAYDGQPYQYVYVAGVSDVDGKGVYKINTKAREVLEWSENGCECGEPVFIASPDSQEEDDGVILAVIIDHNHNDSFLLILDAKSFKEIGRARAPHLIPAGLHGQFFPYEHPDFNPGR